MPTPLIEKPKPVTPEMLKDLWKRLEDLHKRRLLPTLTILEPKNGSMCELGTPSTGIPVRITWSTPVQDGTLKVFFDSTDITTRLTIDPAGGTAIGILPGNEAPFAEIRWHAITASGEFLSQLLPFRFTHLNASTAFQTSPG